MKKPREDRGRTFLMVLCGLVGLVPPSLAQEPGYVVQAIASGDSAAVAEQARLLSEKLENGQTIRVVRSGPWFKLHVGDFASPARARSTLEAVRRAGYPDAWVANGVAVGVADTTVGGPGIAPPQPRAAAREPRSRLRTDARVRARRQRRMAPMRRAEREPRPDPAPAAAEASARQVVADPDVESGAPEAGRGEPDLEARRIPIDLPRIGGSIHLDGVIDEPAWRDIDPFPITVYSPTYGQEPTERTEFRIAYDDEYVYVAGSMYDSDPGAIEANTFYRDASQSDDQLGVVFDSYNDFETGLTFLANPNGARSDRSIANDAQFVFGAPSSNSDWNAHWDLATRRTDEGWFAEMRIPFSSLGFQAREEAVVMGLSMYRTIARKNERHVYPDNSPARGFFGFGKPSLAQRVRLRGVQRRAPLYVTPYLVGGSTRTPVLRSPPDVPSAVYVSEEDRTWEPGIDLRYSPSSSLSIDLTANTDFAQVEADDQQINLTRFPLFFPEKRQFFQERSSTFDFGTGGFTDRLFFSRRIGLNRGEIVRIYGGVRLVGRLGALDYGVLNMQTAAQGGREGENMGVFRVKQQVLNPFSSIGGMVTTRFGSAGEDNVAYGLDATVRPFGDEYLTVKWAQTFDEDVEEGGALDAGLIRARWERRRQDGLSYAAEYGRVGPDYLPRLGFQSRRDFSVYGGEIGYAWFPGVGSPFRTIGFGASTAQYFRNSDQTPESRVIRPEALVGFKDGGFITASATSSFESIRDPFPIAGIDIEPGEYWFHQGQLSYRWSRAWPVRGAITGSAGSFYDGTRVGGSITPSFNLSSHLEVEPSYQINRFRFDEEELTTHLARLRLNFALDTHLSLSAFGQYNSVTDQTSLNARFRYHFREGTDLWIVYNEGFNLERDASDPRLPFSAGRSLFVKYSHTLGF